MARSSSCSWLAGPQQQGRVSALTSQVHCEVMQTIPGVLARRVSLAQGSNSCGSQVPHHSDESQADAALQSECTEVLNDRSRLWCMPADLEARVNCAQSKLCYFDTVLIYRPQ